MGVVEERKRNYQKANRNKLAEKEKREKGKKVGRRCCCSGKKNCGKSNHPSSFSNRATTRKCQPCSSVASGFWAGRGEEAAGKHIGASWQEEGGEEK